MYLSNTLYNCQVLMLKYGSQLANGYYFLPYTKV